MNSRMIRYGLLHLLVFVVLWHEIDANGGSPVLIKMDGKKGKKGKGNLILISGGKCGSPTLIKGGGKKEGPEMILVGGQNGDCDKPKVHVVKQYVPIPYYVPKPIYKYILRHHYVPVRQVVVKQVPVPYPVKTYDHGGYSGGGGGGGGYSGSGSSHEAYSSESGDSMYNSEADNGYSGSSNYDNVAPYGGEVGSGKYLPNQSSGYGRYPSSASSAAAAANTNSIPNGNNNNNHNNNNHNDYSSNSGGANPHAEASENYYFAQAIGKNGGNSGGGRHLVKFSGSKDTSHLPLFHEPGTGPGSGSDSQFLGSQPPPPPQPGYVYAPVYEGPNGQQIIGSAIAPDSSAGYHNSSGAEVLRSQIPKSAYSSIAFGKSLSSSPVSAAAASSSYITTSGAAIAPNYYGSRGSYGFRDGSKSVAKSRTDSTSETKMIKSKQQSEARNKKKKKLFGASFRKRADASSSMPKIEQNR